MLPSTGAMANVCAVGGLGCSPVFQTPASAVPNMLVNGRSENALFFDGIFFESSLKSIFFVS